MRRSLVVLLAVVLVGCGQRATIRGHIVCGGEGSDSIFLDEVRLSGPVSLDTAVTADGKFRFRVKFDSKEAMIYNIRCKHQVIPLLVSPGERVKVTGFGNVARNYVVSGSAGSEQMRELAMILNNGAAKLDSLNNIYTRMSASDPARAEVTKAFVKAYLAVKQDQIRFIVTNMTSVAALYGLYQRLPNDNVLFNGMPADLVYYRQVADSVESAHPGSPYLKALRADLGRMQGTEFDASLVHQVNYPDIEMPDLYGKPAKLSSLEGGVVLLDFWSASVPRCLLLNGDLKGLYTRLHPQGFEVYQVSVDTDKALWVNTVLDQKLPWTSVCDLRGSGSPAVRIYNVKGVPANFLLDRQGNLVGKDLYGLALENKVKGLL